MTQSSPILTIVGMRAQRLKDLKYIRMKMSDAEFMAQHASKQSPLQQQRAAGDIAGIRNFLRQYAHSPEDMSYIHTRLKALEKPLRKNNVR